LDGWFDRNVFFKPHNDQLAFSLISGIMAILFCGIVMSHYTHFNLSPMTQITVQQIFRTTAFMAGTVNSSSVLDFSAEKERLFLYSFWYCSVSMTADSNSVL